MRLNSPLRRPRRRLDVGRRAHSSSNGNGGGAGQTPPLFPPLAFSVSVSIGVQPVNASAKVQDMKDRLVAKLNEAVDTGTKAPQPVTSSAWTDPHSAAR